MTGESGLAARKLGTALAELTTLNFQLRRGLACRDCALRVAGCLFALASDELIDPDARALLDDASRACRIPADPAQRCHYRVARGEAGRELSTS